MTRPRPIVLGAVFVVVALALAGLIAYRVISSPDHTTASPPVAGTSSVPAASASPSHTSQKATQAPTMASPSTEKCPTPDYNGDRSSIENRAFDFVEASKLTDPVKRRKALETTGTPPRLVKDNFFEEELPPPASNGDGDLTYIIKRDLNNIEATPIDKTHMSVIIASPIWTSCRGGNVVNTWTEPDVFITNSWSLWEGVWYADPGQS